MVPNGDFSHQKIAFLGCGSMGEAIMAGLLGAGFPAANVISTTRSSESSARLTKKYGIRAQSRTDTMHEDGKTVNARAAASSDIIVLGVKPKDIKALAEEIAASLKPGSVVISVAAAISIKVLESVLPSGQPVVRSMPNTPLMVGRGVVGISPGTYCDDNDLERARQVFSTSGTVVVVPEERQDVVSAISGSGPAYVFYFAEALSSAAQALGLDPRTADIIAQDTVVGAGAMLDQPDSRPERLRKAVTSPNGTTERAIAVFKDQGLFDLVRAAAQASMRRSAEMSAEIEG